MSKGRVASIVIGILVLILAIAFLRSCRQGSDAPGVDDRMERPASHVLAAFAPPLAPSRPLPT